jgi:uncharacterized membrane protein YagU involved in acid resistance
MLGQASNPMLTQAEQGIQAKVPQQFQGALTKVVKAGMTVMYAPQTKDVRMKRIAQTTDPIKDAGEGAARLIANLYAQSNKTMPQEVVVPACMVFAFEYLDLMGQSGKIKITPDVIAQVAISVKDAVLPLFGVTPEKYQQLKQFAASHQGQAQQPAQGNGIINQAGA